MRTALVSFEGYQIEAQQFGDTTKPRLLLIHGSPGDWGAWKNILGHDSILQQFCIVTYNRPGYKGTNLPATSDLSLQAEVANAVMQHFGNSEPYTLAGHSYGGAVVAQLLIDYSSQCSKAVMVAATLSPVLQKPKWYNKIGASWPVKGLLPASLKSSNIEMSGLAIALAQNEAALRAIAQPIIVIQGERDILVPFATVDYIKTHKPAGVTYLLEKKMNHFVPWSHPELIIKALLTSL